MCKILLPICFVLLALTSASARSPRVLGGLKIKDGDVKEYVFIYVFFEQQWQHCGGAYIADKWILTTKSCVSNLNEKTTNVTVVVPTVRTPFRVSVANIFIKTAVTDAASFYGDDFALLKIPTLVAGTLKLDSKKVAPKTPTTTDPTTVTVNSIYKICGFGSTQNSPNYPQKSILCANVTVVSAERCTPTEAAPPNVIEIDTPDDATTVCLAPNNNANTCAGDYGGPLYRQGSASDYIGLLSFSPNWKKSSSCQDGHNTVAAIYTTEVNTWVTDTMTANP